MNWFKKANQHKLEKTLEQKKQISLNKGSSQEQVDWAGEMSFRLRDPSFFVWLLNQTKNGSANIETGEDNKKIFNVINKFIELKKKRLLGLEQPDINKYKTFSDLHKLVSSFEEQSHGEIKDRVSKLDGAEVIFQNENVSVVRVDKYEAGKELFSDTGWCVKYKNDFDHYGPPYYMFTRYNKPYALYHESSKQFKDEHDGAMSLDKTIPLLESLKALINKNIIFPPENTETSVINLAINKEKEINSICEKKDFDLLRDVLKQNLEYCALLDKYYLSQDIINVVKNVFIEGLKNDKEKYEPYSVPEYLKNDKDISKSFKEFWINRLKNYPRRYSLNNFPKHLKEDPDILAAIKPFWMKSLKEHTRGYTEDYFPKHLKSDIDILKLVKEFWIHRLKYIPHEYLIKSFPPHLKNDEDILKLIKEFWMNSIKNDPYTYGAPTIPSHLKQDEDILQSLKEGWINKLKTNPYDYLFFPEFPSHLKQDEDILQSLKEGWINKLKTNPREYVDSEFPSHLKQDEDILKLVKEIWINIIKNNPDEYTSNYIPAYLKNDPDILEIVNKNNNSPWWQQQPVTASCNWFKKAQNEDEDIPEWSFEEASHDYNPNWDYEMDNIPDKSLMSISENIMTEINSKLMPEIGMGIAKAAYIKNDNDILALYAYGTAPYPVFMINLNGIKKAAEDVINEYGGDVDKEIYIGIKSTLMHELGHAIQDWLNLELDEDEVEDFARTYCDYGKIWNFWETNE